MNSQNVAVWDERSGTAFPYADHDDPSLRDESPDLSTGRHSALLTPYRFTEERECERVGFEGIVGSSEAFMEVLDLVRTVAPTDSTVLIEGETGTELIAGAIHALSKRKDRPSCSSMFEPPWRVELVNQRARVPRGSSVRIAQQLGSGDQDWKERRFERIIGHSSALKAVLEEVERVAPADSTVLIQGETGTGKELIAHAIHNLSSRSGRAFVRVNCAAIPLDLLESELFGHEKGAFTGAIAQKIGRFEVADKGTLFLDEVGDIPPALQPKLLRVLQEQEFERLGSARTHQVDVRLVAATHRDLTDMVRRGEFRSDLYFRLNVFPVLLPPLRERREDIPELVMHFVEKIGRRVGKKIERIPPATMSALSCYEWPGNIRELQNLIERAVILANDGVLPNPLPSGRRKGFPIPLVPNTLSDAERAVILQTLDEVGWVVGGPKGAALKLGVRRTTLIHKMKRLGIRKPRPHSSSLQQPDST
jgi:formate hydrogenlyase transcriptional activator